MKDLILLFMIVPVIGYSQVVAKEENGAINAGNTVVQSTIKNPSPQEIQHQSNFNIEELKVRWKKAALENCPGVPCITTPPFTCGTSTISDIDGNTYNTVLIGTQCWMKENLKVTKYNDGTNIPDKTSNWGTTPDGARSNYNGTDPNPFRTNFTGWNNFVSTYGYYYNWYAATDSRKICPEGWHVPTAAQWKILIDYEGGDFAAGKSLKTTGDVFLYTGLWSQGNTGTNSTGFSALPGGLRQGIANDLLNSAYFLSATEYEFAPPGTTVYFIYISAYSDNAIRQSMNIQFGASVRCLKD